MKKTKRKIKRGYFIFIVAIVVLFTALAIYFQLTALGYRMTVQYRNFTEIQKNVFVDNSYLGDREEVAVIINEAKNRVSDFWGDTESIPTVIISDNARTIAKLGGDHDTKTTVLFQVYSYISISNEYLNVDIVAHELTHAELHKRLYTGKQPQTVIPIWFDEGVALQNDYREPYSEEKWIQHQSFIQEM